MVWCGGIGVVLFLLRWWGFLCVGFGSAIFFVLVFVGLLVVVVFCGWGVFGWIFPWDSLRRFRLDLALT